MNPRMHHPARHSMCREHRLIADTETPRNPEGMPRRNEAPRVDPNNPPVQERVNRADQSTRQLNAHVARMRGVESGVEFGAMMRRIDQSFTQMYMQRFGRQNPEFLAGSAAYNAFKREWADQANRTFDNELSQFNIFMLPGLQDNWRYMWTDRNVQYRELTRYEKNVLGTIVQNYNNEGGSVGQRNINQFKEEFCSRINRGLDQDPAIQFRLYAGIPNTRQFSIAWNGVDANLRPLPGPAPRQAPTPVVSQPEPPAAQPQRTPALNDRLDTENPLQGPTPIRRPEASAATPGQAPRTWEALFTTLGQWFERTFGQKNATQGAPQTVNTLEGNNRTRESTPVAAPIASNGVENRNEPGITRLNYTGTPLVIPRVRGEVIITYSGTGAAIDLQRGNYFCAEIDPNSGRELWGQESHCQPCGPFITDTTRMFTVNPGQQEVVIAFWPTPARGLNREQRDRFPPLFRVRLVRQG